MKFTTIITVLNVNLLRISGVSPNEKMQHGIRPVVRSDLLGLKSIIDSTGIFPSELLDGMMEKYLSGANADCEWLTCEEDGKLVGVCYYAMEKLTNKTWNLLLIAIHSETQRTGIGSRMISYIFDELRRKSQRLLIVETSSLADFEKSRMFYEKNGFELEGRVRDFYDTGDDKIIYRKKI